MNRKRIYIVVDGDRQKIIVNDIALIALVDRDPEYSDQSMAVSKYCLSVHIAQVHMPISFTMIGHI